MQTFLPYSDFAKCARVLDRQRLGKQRVECKQILVACAYGSKGWVNHPIVKMWRGYEFNLRQYAIAICNEWISRGYKDNLLPFFEGAELRHSGAMPFIGNRAFHSQYRRILYGKNPVYYSVYFGKLIPLDSLPYESWGLT